MISKQTFAIMLSIFFVAPGCLDSFQDDLDPNSFWGDNCEVVIDDICKSGPAPDFNLIDQYNNSVNMSQFKGKIVIITFVYTHCPDVCPAVTFQMKKIAEELGSDFGESVVFLTMTVDPERDTPERLHTFASNYNASWQFITSDAQYPVGAMASVWHDYGIFVDIDEDACSGNGHYMDMDNNTDTPDECHCNVGFTVNPYNVDECIEDPDYDKSNITFEEGSLESDIIKALDLWSTGIPTDEQAMAGIDVLISQIFGPDWKFSDMNNTMHSSSDYYSQNLTLVEFFHTDCSHCQAQVSILKEFHSNYSSNVNLISMGGYSLGSKFDNMSTIENFTVEYNASWTYLYDDSNQMMQSFGLGSYPSWILFDGDQIVSTSQGTKTYLELVDMVENHTAAIVPSVELSSILFSLDHWAQFDDEGNRHVSDKDMINSIIVALNYDYEEPKDEFDNYGVSHSSKLYIIDQEGNMRVVWRGYDWTYASVYHDIELLL